MFPRDLPNITCGSESYVVTVKELKEESHVPSFSFQNSSIVKGHPGQPTRDQGGVRGSTGVVGLPDLWVPRDRFRAPGEGRNHPHPPPETSRKTRRTSKS